MRAVRQFAQVVNNRVTIDLPSDFATGQVEVIVLSAAEAVEGRLPPHNPAVRAFMKLDTSTYTPEQKAAYDRVVAYIRRGRKAGEPYPLGLFAGLVEVSDDFDDPLPDEDIWYGSETDEYGISLPQINSRCTTGIPFDRLLIARLLQRGISWPLSMGYSSNTRRPCSADGNFTSNKKAATTESVVAAFLLLVAFVSLW